MKNYIQEIELYTWKKKSHFLVHAFHQTSTYITHKSQRTFKINHLPDKPYTRLNFAFQVYLHLSKTHESSHWEWTYYFLEKNKRHFKHCGIPCW